MDFAKCKKALNLNALHKIYFIKGFTWKEQKEEEKKEDAKEDSEAEDESSNTIIFKILFFVKILCCFAK